MRAALIFLFCVACSAPPQPPPAPTPPPTTQQAISGGDTGAILKNLSRPYEESSKLFGPHQLKLSVQSKLTKDKEAVVDLQEDLLLSLDKHGTIHAQTTNNQNQGIDAYLQRDKASMATRYGPLQPAPVEAANKAINNAFSTAYANLEPLSHWLNFAPGEEKDFSGKKALVYTLSKKEAGPQKASTLLPDKAWRATIEPELLSGELAIEPQSGLLVFADLQLRYTAVRSEQKIQFEVNIKASLTTQGEAAAAIAVPEMKELDPKPRLEKERLDLIGKAALQQQKESKKKKPKAAPKTTPTSAPK